MYILITCIVAIVAFSVGFLISYAIRQNGSHSGVMKITRDENRVLYTLELNEDPIVFENMSKVVFKVETSDESSIAEETIHIMNSTEGD